VQIPDREHARSIRDIGTDLRPELSPAIVGGAEKWKDGHLHVGVLQAEILFDDHRAIGEPLFVAARGLDEIHSAER
jgi:hypothetical protein